jgi:hypothetical protein
MLANPILCADAQLRPEHLLRRALPGNPVTGPALNADLSTGTIEEHLTVQPRFSVDGYLSKFTRHGDFDHLGG